MAVEYFLRFDPASGIKGESVADKHAGDIDVLSWSLGASNVASFSGGGGGAGKVSLSALGLTKRLDLASTGLLLACATGRHIASATLVARKAGAEAAEFMTITLTDVLISGVQDAGSAGDVPTESVSIAFARIKLDYAAENPTGGQTPGPSFGWDVTKNAKF